MMFKKTIWMTFSGNIRDGKSQIIMCTSSKRKLKSFIASKIRDNAFVYGNNGIKKRKQIKNFKLDLKAGQLGTINSTLRGGYVDYTYDGEEY